MVIKLNKPNFAWLAGSFMIAFLATFTFTTANAQESEVAPTHELRLVNGKLVCSHAHGSTISNFESLKSVERFKQITERRPERVTKSIFEVDYFGYGPVEQAAFQAAIDEWSKTVSSEVPIRVLAVLDDLGNNIIAQAGPNFIWRDFPGAERPGTWYVDALADKLAGFDLAPGQYDMQVTFNSRFAPLFYFGESDNVPSDLIDYYTVVLHELCHGLGLLGVSGVDNTFGQGFMVLSGHRYVLNQHLVTKNPTPEYLTDLPEGSVALGNALTSNNLFFSGIVSEGQRGGPPRMYAPSFFRGGSSISHLDEFTYPGGSLNSLMTPFAERGIRIKTAGPMVKSIFTDIGWGGPSPRRSGLNDRTSYTYNGHHNHDHGNGHAGYNPRSGGSNPTGGRFGLQADMNTQHTASYQVFPNPTINSIALTIPAGIEGMVDVRMTDVAGKTYHLGPVDASAARTAHFDLTKFKLSAGVYYMNIYDANAKQLVSLPIIKRN